MRNGEAVGDGGGIYERIFFRVGNAGGVRRAIALAVRELRASMEKEENSAVIRAHVRNLDDIAPELLARAYALAERTCIYWPTPGQIRDLAGFSETHRCEEALEWALRYLEEHGAEGRPRGGGVTYGDNGSGRRVMLATEPTIRAPELSPLIERALVLLGRGSLKHGFFYLGQHPRVRGWDEAAGDAPTITAERIERQWMRCCAQALREQALS